MTNDWVDLEAVTELDERHLPKAIRDPGDTRAHVSSLVAAFGDPWINPSSGGVIGTYGTLAKALNVSTKQARRIMQTKEAGFIRRYDKKLRLLAWNQSSMDNFKGWRAANVRVTRPRNENGPEARAAICLSRALEESQ